jgi:hypothetical protein
MDFDLRDAASRSRADRRAQAEALRARLDRQAELTAAAERGELKVEPAEPKTAMDEAWETYKRLYSVNSDPRDQGGDRPSHTGLYAAPNHRGPRRLKPANPDLAFSDAIRQAHRSPRSTKDQVIGGKLPRVEP